MDRIRSLFAVEAPVADPARDLVSGGDDFAVTIASTHDRRFWVRIEREREDDTIVVTDFSPGASSSAELAAALAMGVRAVTADRIGALAFRDLVPAGTQAPLYPARIVQAADLVKQLAAAVAAHLATAVASFEMTRHRGKIDARVTFA